MAFSGSILTLRFDITKFRDPNTDLGELAYKLFQEYGPDCAEVLAYDGTCKSMLDRMEKARQQRLEAVDLSHLTPVSPSYEEQDQDPPQLTAKPAAAAAAVSPKPLKRPSLPPMLPDQDQDQDQPPKKKAAIEHIDLSEDTSSSEEELEIDCDVSSSDEEEEEQEEGELCPHCECSSDKFVSLSEAEKKRTDFPDYDKLCPACANDCWETVGECHLCDKICGLITTQDWQGVLNTERLTDLPTEEGDRLDLDEPVAACKSCYEIIMADRNKRAKNYKNKELGFWLTHLPEYTIKPCKHCNEHTLAVQCNRLEERIACVQCLETYE